MPTDSVAAPRTLIARTLAVLIDLKAGRQNRAALESLVQELTRLTIDGSGG
ncbi:hypothetical protein [Synechococcus sp. PCC 7336]|uniref:hypothetical protein n=1 Tax=Synechococcus sp. PCC 7336 TaxID=195250 RepID=UPI000349B3BA|nr:hypothetical protein [Synechococcus sp. PCC 7336]